MSYIIGPQKSMTGEILRLKTKQTAKIAVRRKKELKMSPISKTRKQALLGSRDLLFHSLNNQLCFCRSLKTRESMNSAFMFNNGGISSG